MYSDKTSNVTFLFNFTDETQGVLFSFDWNRLQYLEV